MGRCEPRPTSEGAKFGLTCSKRGTPGCFLTDNPAVANPQAFELAGPPEKIKSAKAAAVGVAKRRCPFATIND